MTNTDTKYQRVRNGVAEEKAVLWLPVELKAELKRIATARGESMSDSAAEAISMLIARVKSAEDALIKARAERARLIEQATATASTPGVDR